MIYVKDYNSLKNYIKNQKKTWDCIDYRAFIGKRVGIYVGPGVCFRGILIHNHARSVELILRVGYGRRRTTKVIIEKSCIVALAYRYG